MEPIQVYVKEGETINLVRKKSTKASLVNGGGGGDKCNGKDDENEENAPLGACLLCHHVLMLLSLKQQLLGEGDFRFIIHRINTTKPPEQFRQQCLRNIPAIYDPNTDQSFDHECEIIDYLDAQYPTPALMASVTGDSVSDSDGTTTTITTEQQLNVMRLGAELFKRFTNFIKNPTKDGGQLLSTLHSLDAHLLMMQQNCNGKSSSSPFIFGPHITSFDAELMPKLHHIRVACYYIRQFEWPTEELINLWRYLYRAYHCPAFLRWCASDQEIIIHWTNKAAVECATARLTFEEKRALIKAQSCYKFSMPNEQLARKFSEELLNDG